MLLFLTLLEGFGLSASLIIAIGAQNAFVLRQGLKRQHVFLSAAFCSLADLALIAGGVFGLGALVREQAWFLTLMTWGGAVFLGWYGTKAARRAWKPGTLEAGDELPLPLSAVVATLAAFTFLNPHVYLDTGRLLGGFGARHPVPERINVVTSHEHDGDRRKSLVCECQSQGRCSADRLWRARVREFFVCVYQRRAAESPGSRRILGFCLGVPAPRR